MVKIEDIVGATKEKTFHVDCFEMTLLQNKIKNPVSYRGKGFVSQTADDTLTLKLYASEAKNSNQLTDLTSYLGIAPGHIYREDAYYSLTAVAGDGTVWAAERIIPRCAWAGRDAPIVTATIAALRSTEPWRVGPFRLQMHFFDDFELPCLPAARSKNATTPQFRAAGAQFVISKQPNEVIVEVESSDRIGEDFPTRVEEALRFLTAQPVSCRVLIRFDGPNRHLELFFPARKYPTFQLGPPLSPGTSYFFHGTTLFSRYLEYVVANTQHRYWNNATYHIHNACEASAASIDAWAMGVCVAVEGLANLIAVDRTPEQKRKVKEFRRWVVGQTASHERFGPFSRRLDGLLGMLSNDRVQDRLKTLFPTGHIFPDYVFAWGKLRNRQVHPKEHDLRQIISGGIQPLLNRIHQTTVLMYQIIFYLIGYEGPYTDYGTYYFPTDDYPLPRRGLWFWSWR